MVAKDAGLALSSRVYPVNPTLCCPQFAGQAAQNVTSMATHSTARQQTLVGMMFAETDDELAYLVFVSSDYPERAAKQLAAEHARAVKSMTLHGASTRPHAHTQPILCGCPAPSVLTLVLHRHIRQRAWRGAESRCGEGACSSLRKTCTSASWSVATGCAERAAEIVG